MKIRKIILRITLTFCALLLGAVALVFLLLVLGIRIDLAPFHGKLEAAVTEAAGRKVTIAEPLSVKLSFLPLVEAVGGLWGGSGP